VEIWEEEKGMKTILPPQNKVVQELQQTEENGCPDQDSNKTKINDTKVSNDNLKNN
jgi:hypothetical protein